MPAISEPGFLVLHALRLKGFAGVEEVAASTGLDPNEIRTLLDKAVADALATYREGRITGWALSREGRAGHPAAVRHELATKGDRAAIEDAYERFLALNQELLASCTDWQMRDAQPNTHTDAAYDAAVVARLCAVDDGVQPICADLGSASARFELYAPRLAEARRHIAAGDGDWVARPGMDSYHTVWFELHEDLLVTLGIERSKEGSTA